MPRRSAIRPDGVDALTLDVDPNETRDLLAAWDQRSIPVPLKVLEAPYRDLVRPLIAHVKALRRESPHTVIMVFLPEYVLTRWWQQLLHNQSALRFKARLLFTPSVVVVDVPYQLGAGDQGWLGSHPHHPPTARPTTASPPPQASPALTSSDVGSTASTVTSDE